MSPVQDVFLSSSVDKTVRLWDLQSSRCEATMQVPCEGIPVASFDPDGIIFAVGYNSSIIKLYDMSSFSKGPFQTFDVPKIEPVNDWTDLKFSPDGRKILLSTVDGHVIVVDAFKGDVMFNLNTQESGSQACFCSNGKFIFSGANNSSVGVWSADYGTLITRLKMPNRKKVHGVTFNPRSLMLAASCENELNILLHSDLIYR